jgi:ribosomal protein S18 acetylase RimI-like enzyme
MDYKTDVVPSAEALAALYLSAGLNRPISDLPRIAAMYANSNLIVTAWDGDLLVGVSRALSDFSFCCYLSDLAVHQGYKRSGIGKKLIEITKEKIGPQCCL